MADLSTVFDGLNVLGRVPWRINKNILDVAKRCWDDDVALGDIPSRTDFEVPEEPDRPTQPSLLEIEKGTDEYKETLAVYQKYYEARNKFNRIIQKNMVSLNSIQ